MVKLLYVINVDWFFISHRLPIALTAMKNGYDVSIICEDTGRRRELEQVGLKFIPLPFNREKKFNPIGEIRYVVFLYKAYKAIKPDIIHQITIKPILYGSLIVKFLKNKPSLVNAISGMGFLFTGYRKIVFELLFMPLFRVAFKQKKLNIIVQNDDDFNLFLIKKLAIISQLKLIKGSGVNLNVFQYSPIPEIVNGSIKVILPSRMIWDKGIKEFYFAAMILKKKYPNLVFTLCGDIDKANPRSVHKEQLEKWNHDGIVSWIGHQTEMTRILAEQHIVVLPSYREGLPKSLIEACSIGRPIITTETNGCKECVVHEENGFLIPVKDIKKLVESIEYFVVNREKLSEFGLKSRQKAEKEFDINYVIAKTIDIYEMLLS